MPEILAGPVEEMDAARSAEGDPEAVAQRSFLEEYKTYVDSETEVFGAPPQDIYRPNNIDPPFSIGSAWSGITTQRLNQEWVWRSRTLKVQACILRVLGLSTRPAEGKAISLIGRRRTS